MEAEVRALSRTKLVVEPDPGSGGVCLTGELDFDVVPEARAEIAVRLLNAPAQVVDLSGLTLLTGSAVALIEELLEDGATIRCALGSPADETLRDTELSDRIETVLPPQPRRPFTGRE